MKIRDRFSILALYKETAEICFDKFEMFRYLQNQKIKTVLTYEDIESFKKGLTENKIEFPVFVKPRRGSGSVGARKISDMNNPEKAFNADPTLIIQKFMGDAYGL